MDIQAQTQQMLSIIYQIPVGIVQTDEQGAVQEMNAMAIQYLMPHFVANGLTGENLFDLLAQVFPLSLEALKKYNKPSGNILQQERFSINPNNQNTATEQHLILTINRLDKKSYLFILDDLTELYQKEQKLFAVQQEQALERDRFEVISGVLHDIGNAVVGFGSYLTKVKQLTKNNEATMLGKLAQFVKANELAIAQAIGAPKAQAMLQLIDGLKAKQEDHTAKMEKAITDQMNIVTHVKDVLNIQRQYIGSEFGERALVSFRGIVNDALAMQLARLEKRNIEVRTHMPDQVPPVKGDHTKLMQVFLNLLKNSVEAMDQKGGDGHTLTLELSKGEGSIIARLSDTGIGFDEQQKQRLFQRGFTTKPMGSGLGLNGSRSILQTHNATIDVESPGPGMGATATITYPLSEH